MTERRKVLIVDDEHHIVQMLAMLLETRGYEVEVAQTGKEALEKAAAKPDIILLDLVLPDIEGFEVCRYIRENKETRQIPIIILTVRYLFEDKIEGLYLGADDYLTKPFENEELFARMEAVLRRRFSFNTYFQDKEPLILELRRILKEELLIPFYQPIFLLHPFKLLGFEVLSRTPLKSRLANPDILFKAALQFGLYCELEMLGWQRAAKNFPDCPPGTKLFLNCNPYIIESPEFYKIKSTFDEAKIKPQDVILEITERSAISDFKLFQERLHFYHNCGVNIAIDDVGGGFASLESIVLTKPAFVKIDRHIVANLRHDPLKGSLVKFITGFCKENNIQTIAEGIETQEDFNAVRQLGVDAVQGYLFCRPAPEINLDEIYEKLSQELQLEAFAE